MIDGVGPDAPTVVNEIGAKQSDTPYLFTDFDPMAMLDIAKVSANGNKKYGPNNWANIPTNDHLNHALTHIFAYLAGDKQDNHLAHAACRLLFAISTSRGAVI